MRINLRSPGIAHVVLEDGDDLINLEVNLSDQYSIIINGDLHGPESRQSEATDSNVHELPSAYRLHITSPDDSSEYPQEGRVCSHFPEHDLLDTRCEDRYPKEGH